MRHRPEGETRKDRRNQLMVGVGILLIFALLGVIVVQGVIQYRSQTNHHAASVKSDQELAAAIQTVHAAQLTNKGTLTAISNLEKEVATVIAGLPAADAELVTEAEGLNAQIAALCAVTPNANCPPLPALP